MVEKEWKVLGNPTSTPSSLHLQNPKASCHFSWQGRPGLPGEVEKPLGQQHPPAPCGFGDGDSHIWGLSLSMLHLLKYNMITEK